MRVGVPVSELVPEPLALPERVDESVPVSLAEPLALWLSVPVPVLEGVDDAVPESVTVVVGVADDEGVSVVLPEPLPEGVAAPLGVADPERVPDADGVSVCEGLCVRVGVPEPVRVAPWLADWLGLGACETVAVALLLGVTAPDAVPVALLLCEAVELREGESVGELVPEGVRVLLGVGTGEDDRVAVPARRGGGRQEGWCGEAARPLAHTRSPLRVHVCEGDWLRVCVTDALSVPLSLAVSVRDAVPLGVALALGVELGLRVPVGVVDAAHDVFCALRNTVG